MCKFVQAQAALMYDGVQVLIDAIFRLLRKKPDILRGLTRRSARSSSNKTLDCFPKIGTGTYEIGDKISRLIKKVSYKRHSLRILSIDQGKHNVTIC